MRVIGIDLAVRAKHQAVIGDQQGRFISPGIKFETRLADLDQLRARALQGTNPELLDSGDGSDWHRLVSSLGLLS